MQIFDILKQEHQEVSQLLDELNKSTTRAEKSRTEKFIKLREALLAHMDAEEETFYAALGKHKEGQELVVEGIDEHRLAQMQLTQVGQVQVTDESFTPKIKVLKDVIEHHVEEEEGEMFKTARELFKADEATQIGMQFQQAKQRFMQQPKMGRDMRTGMQGGQEQRQMGSKMK